MKNTLAILASLALGAALNLSAQDAPPPAEGGPGFGPHGRGHGGPPPGPPPIIGLLDADKDGVLSEAEINQASAKLLTLDANQDGQLIAEELHVGPKPGDPNCPEPGQKKGKQFAKGRGPMGPPPLIRVLDADGDKVLSSAEIQNAAAALLTLDANQDKQLTPDELRPRDGRGRPGHAPEDVPQEPAQQ